MSQIATMRSFCALGLLFASQALYAAAPAPLPPNAVVLTTKHMCCAKESVPAIKELRKIPGVQNVVANYKTRSLTIIPKEDVYPSLRAMWEAAERAQVEPIRLNTAELKFDKRPLR
ncbi:MAG TPA: hypothetical protein VL096_18180 [Pirellulaceae bacterium]|nr:hypothetical protein [Pirellulaceae bacterium]